MFQLYKLRSFGDYFQDTFAFLKQNGRHFFRNLFIVNGIFLLIMTAIYIFLYNSYLEILLNEMIANNNPNAIADYFLDNTAGFVLIFSLILIVFILASTFQYAFVPIYFKLYEKNGGSNFSSNDIFAELKANIGKILTYTVVSFFIALLMIAVIAMLMFVLFVTIIGIPIALIGFFFAIAIFMMFFHTTLMEYLSSNKGLGACYEYAIRMCFQKFFPAIGAIILFLLLLYIFKLAIGIIQFIITTILGITSLSDPNSLEVLTDSWSFQFIILTLFQILTYVIDLLTGSVSQVNQGIIYYGLKEEKENIHSKTTIDEIGSGF